MPKLYTARVLADSKILTADGKEFDPVRRCITIEATYPRMILAEENTHRTQSRNSASSRAKKPEDVIKQVMEEPYVPLAFNKRVKGMGVGDPLPENEARIAHETWMWLRDQAVEGAQRLVRYNVDKSRVNRVLEPYMPHTMIMTGTTHGWDNYMALRVHPNAQPEFKLSAEVMLKAMLESTPTVLEPGQWALPLVNPDELRSRAHFGDTRFMADLWPGEDLWDKVWPLISASRCARISYDTHENFETVEKSVGRAKTLVTNGHLSPLEHVVRAPTEEEVYDSAVEGRTGILKHLAGNLPGFVQLRKLIPHDWNRVGFIENRMSWEEMEIPDIPLEIAA